MQRPSFTLEGTLAILVFGVLALAARGLALAPSRRIERGVVSLAPQSSGLLPM